nr:hypothetical protein [Tanacetum cinerariifolium]
MNYDSEQIDQIDEDADLAKERSTVVQKSRIQCYNCKEHGHVVRECQKPKRAKDAAYHREKMLLYAVDSGPIFDKEPDQKVQNDDYYDVFAIELDMNYDSEQTDQNDEDADLAKEHADLAKERELLASLIEILKCEINDTKNRNTLLERSNKVLVEKLKSKIEDFKNKNKSLTEANNKLSKENDLLYADFKKSKAELKRRDSIEYATEMELACAKVREMKNKLSTDQDTISILKQQKDAQIKLYKSREDKEIKKVIDLENKSRCLKEEMVADLRYFNSLEFEVDSLRSQLETQKTQFSNEIDRLSREYYYDDHINAILGVYTKLDKDLKAQLQDKGIVIRVIPTTSVSRPQPKSNPQGDRVLDNNSRGKKLEVEKRRRNIKLPKNKTSVTDSLNAKTLTVKFVSAIFWERSNFGNDQIAPILGYGDLVQGATMIKRVYYVEGLNHNLFFVGQFCDADLEVAFRKSTCFIYDLKGNDLLTASSSQAWLWHRRLSYLNFDTINLLSKNDIVVGLPKLKFIKDYLCSSLEDHRRSVKLSKNKTSVIACNDSLNAKTLNVKSVSAMCDKCMLINKHDMCVLKSVAKPVKETVDSESNKKPRNNVRKLYERLRKIYKWSYIKFTPSGYMWKPKSPTGNVNPNVSLPIDNVSQTANVLKTKTSREVSGNIKFGNDQIAPILGYGDLVQGAVTIKRVYYAEGLNHNLFSVSQFCDADLEVAFRKSTCFIRDLKGNDLLIASINGKRYVLVIVDDYSRYTWTHFLRSKDETPEVLIDFLRLVQRGLQAQVRIPIKIELTLEQSQQGVSYDVLMIEEKIKNTKGVRLRRLEERKERKKCLQEVRNTKANAGVEEEVCFLSLFEVNLRVEKRMWELGLIKWLDQGCGGYIVWNKWNKKYNKYKDNTLCKGMLVGILRMRFGDYLVKDYVSGGLKMKMKNMKIRMKSKD